MKGSQLKRLSIVIAVCATVGAIAGIAGSAAAPSGSSSKQALTKAQKQAFRAKLRAFRARGFGLRMGGPMVAGPGFMFGPVHEEVVIPKPDGSGFMTITTDSGTLNSVDGTTVHLKEGTDKATYKDDAAIDVGSDARVRRDGKDAKLSDLAAGDHVRVITGTPKGSLVLAADDAFLKQMKQKLERGFRHHEFMPGGPPPGAPGMYP